MLGVRVILRLRVVPGECPPLLSKPACAQLGMVIDAEHHQVSSRKLHVSRYGLSQTFGGHYVIPIAEFSGEMGPIQEPHIPQHLEAVPVYVNENFEASLNPTGSATATATSALRSWARHDKRVSNTVGPGTNGPAWEFVVRRVVYDAMTGEKLFEEPVCPKTPARQPLPGVFDTTTIFMFNTRAGPFHRQPVSNSMTQEALPSATPVSHGAPLAEAPRGGDGQPERAGDGGLGLSGLTSIG